MALQGPVTVITTYLQAADDDDFVRFSDNEKDPYHKGDHYNEPYLTGSPSQLSNDSQDSVGSTKKAGRAGRA